ncbi:unnamed protein product [Caenorhabditis bovis]|uniref:Rho-GAP domain-containing protein n=1 Tax=Caenorhabditis bovis TaxID=2654633 RepID=A0A8S1F0J5_9PELO|nr:unnamed protein product [Caenorhabditis bovis]
MHDKRDELDFRLVNSYPCGSKKSSGVVFEPFGTNTRYRLTLGEVQSVNVDLDVAVGNGWTRITLKEVPSFLFDAFQLIFKEGLNIDGIFRREGNSVRLNRPDVHDFYRGLRAIPPEFTVIDVCTLIKRFLRDIKPTLLNSEEIRAKLLKRAARCRDENHFKLSHQEIDYIFKSHPMLAPAHLGTLGYVVRMLLRISEYASCHKMTADNLAVVLVGAIFGDFMGGGTDSRKKGAQHRKCTQKELMSKKDDMNLQVAAVKLLIINANLIGLPTGHYVSSNRHLMPHSIVRSTSAMPNIRCSSSSDNDFVLDSIAKPTPTTPRTSMFGVSNRNLCRRDSDLTGILAAKAKHQKDIESATKVKKRSSSFLPITSLRGFREKVSSQFLRRAKSPSPERKPMVSPRKLDFSCSDDEPRSPTIRPMMRRGNTPSVSESRCGSIGSTSSGRQSRSHQARKGTMNSAQRKSIMDIEKLKKPSIVSSESTTSTMTNRSLRRVSQSEQNSGGGAAALKRRESDECRTTASGDTAIVVTPPSLRKKKKKMTPMRRNTVSIGSIICKSNRNKVSTSPQRRATCWEVGTIREEKENVAAPSESCGNLLIGDRPDESVASDTFELTNSFIDVVNHEARRRRACFSERRQRKKPNSESLMVLNGSAVFEKSDVKWRKDSGNDGPDSVVMQNRLQSIVGTPTKAEAAAMAQFLRASTSSTPFTGIGRVAATPMTLTNVDSIGIKKQHENGHVWVGEKQTVMQSPQPKRSGHCEETRAMSAAPNLASMRRATPPPPSSLYTSPLRDPIVAPSRFTIQSPVLRRAFESQQRLSATKTMSPLVTRSKSHLCDEKVSRNEYAALATPPRCRRVRTPPRPSSLIYSTPMQNRKPMGGNPLGTASRPLLSSSSSLASFRSIQPLPPPSPLVFRKAIPSTPTTPHSRKAMPAKDVFKCPVLPPIKDLRPQTKSADLDDRHYPHRPASKEPRHVSTSALEDQIKSRSSSRASGVFDGESDTEFGFGEYNDVIKSANNEMNLPTRHQSLESRPSVVEIRTSNSGFVRSRVNQFQGLSRASIDNSSSGRTSAFSMRSTETLSSVEGNTKPKT